MGTTSIHYGAKPLIAAVIGVILLEVSARAVSSDPLLVTAGIRILDGILIAGISLGWGADARLPGLIPPDFRAGIRKGLIWSAGFGAIAAIAAIALFAAGVNPLRMIRVSLPSGPERIARFFIVGGVIGPIAEELFFRGVIYGFFRRWGAIAAMIGSTAPFVAAHGGGGIALPQLVGGIVFAAAYEKEKNLLVPVIIHTTGNLALFSLGFL